MASVIWVQTKNEAWVPGTVISNDNNTLNVSIKKDNGFDTIKLPGPLSKYDLITSGSLDQQCENLVDLESYSEGIILHHVKKRFQNDNIYTFVGNILVALNPYKQIDIYGQQLMEKIYYSKNKIESSALPHVFTIAAQALNSMKNDNKDQCVLISGESGAGKTEATKRILQFISTMSKSSASRTNISIENQILDSNPILESFGNAKTTRNNNSSRFGKYMEINFDKKHNIKGCNITAYLLEKSRVVKCSKGERNYHIFYMLLAGANSELKQELYLKNADQFIYLTQGNVLEIPKRSDEFEYQQLITAMKNLNIELILIKQIFQCLASILHLGNVEFIPTNDGDGSSISNTNDCKKISQLLDISNATISSNNIKSTNVLETTLCYRENIVNKEVFMIPLSPNKAIEQRDALVKYIYQRIFDVIINTINNSLYRGKYDRNIGVLDIFGFEVFEVNSFEQLCINYCNERLQSYFNEIIFEGEMKMYADDNVNCDDITYQDNIGCLRLIDLKGNGIFSLLDEQGILPQGNDEKLLSKLNQTFSTNPSTKNIYYLANPKKQNEFIVRHFAGDVSYNIINFIDKNKDLLPLSLIKLINQSNITFIHTIDDQSNKSNKLTLSNKFKIDLDHLMLTLNQTTPQFIRCIKPNELQMSNNFHPIVVLNQLKYSGLFEAIKIRKAGYSIRISHQMFINRYKYCIEQRLANELLVNTKNYCHLLMSSIFTNLISKSLYTTNDKRVWTVGNSKVYMKNQELKLALDHLRYIYGTRNVFKVQAIIRGFLARNRVNQLLGISRRQVLLQRKNQMIELDKMKKEDIISYNNEILYRNDIVLQNKLLEAKKLKLQMENERKLKRIRVAVLVLQRYIRGFIGKLKGTRYMCEQVLEQAIKSKNKTQLNNALQFNNKYNNPKSKLISTYKQHIKTLLLSIYQEDYVILQLQECIYTSNVETISNTVHLAEKYQLIDSVEYRQAINTLNQIKNKKHILVNLSNELNQCTNISNLINRSDKLQELIELGISNGLSRETDIHVAIDKLNNIKSLLELRFYMRFAVEICSESKMKKLLKKRNDFSRIYGSDFLFDESQAIIGLLRMLDYDYQLTTQYQVQFNLSKTYDEEKLDSKLERKIDSKIDKQIDSKLDIKDLKLGYESIAITDSDGDDIKLPPFVRTILDDMRNSFTSDDFNKAVQKFILFVPQERKRRIYLRIYKWMVAYCIWIYERSEQETKAHIQQMKSIESDDNSENKRTLLYNINSPEMDQFNELGRKTKYVSPKKLSSSYEFTDKPTGLASTVSKGYKFSSTNDTTISPLKNTSPMKSTSPIKNSINISNSSTPDKLLATSTVFSPFSMKSTKSDIAVHRAIKKAKEINNSNKKSAADRKIEEAMLEYEKFYGKHRLDPKQWR